MADAEGTDDDDEAKRARGRAARARTCLLSIVVVKLAGSAQNGRRRMHKRREETSGSTCQSGVTIACDSPDSACHRLERSPEIGIEVGGTSENLGATVENVIGGHGRGENITGEMTTE